MAQPTRLYQLRELAIRQAFEMLKGTVVYDKDGAVALNQDGSIYLLPPSPAAMNVIRQLLKDNGVDREPVEAEPSTPPLTALIPTDDEEPTLLE